MREDEAQPRLENYLSHMLEATQLARQYVQGMSKDGHRCVACAIVWSTVISM